MPTPGERTSSDSEVSDSQLPRRDAKSHVAPAARLSLSRNGDRSCLRELDHGARIVTGNAGDHPLIIQLLVQARQAPLAEDFQSRLDEPNYRPGDRLLVRRGQTLLGHVHVAGHISWFEGQRIAIVKLEEFAMLPEHRDSSYDRELLAAAESIAAGEGAVLGLVHTDRPEWFARQGWSLLRGQGHTRASARAVLAHLDAQEQTRRRRKTNSQVRTWRHFELDQVRELYDQIAADLWGPLYRSEACWQWLIGRKAQDQVLLAVQRGKGGLVTTLNGDGAGTEHAEEQAAGYAVVSGSCIVEMITAPKQSAARVQLLARACREAMDRDHHSISLYTPAADPLHELLVTAGGAWIDAASNGPRWMVRLLSPERWIERCYPLWRHRARTADVPRPFELGLVTPEASYHLTITRRSSRLEQTSTPPSDQVHCDRPTFDSLLTGNLAIPQAIAQGKLRLSRPELAPPLTALFPARLFWQSPLELMRL
jgi:predicted acetyltransferase